MPSSRCFRVCISVSPSALIFDATNRKGTLPVAEILDSEPHVLRHHGHTVRGKKTEIHKEIHHVPSSRILSKSLSDW